MGSLLIRLNDRVFSASGLKTYIETISGFLDDGLQNLYLFDDSDPKNLALDKKGSYNTSPQTNAAYGSDKANLTGGGGIKLLKDAYVRSGTVNATLPFTIMFSGIFGVPNGGLQPIFGFKEFYDYGWILYGSADNGQASGTLFGVNSRQAKLGEQDGSGSGTHYKGLENYKIGMKATFFAVYNGNGQLQWYIYDGGTLLDTDTGGYLPINETDYTKNASSVVKTSLTPVIGTGNNSGLFSGSNLSVDVFAVYTKALNSSEMILNASSSKSLMISRGR